MVPFYQSDEWTYSPHLQDVPESIDLNLNNSANTNKTLGFVDECENKK